MDARAALACFAALLLAQCSCAAVCPVSCVCSTTPDGLHKATCSNIDHLVQFLRKNKHHNINILDLSHNNITRLTHELDNMSELVALDLSTNGIVKINNFLQNTTKLVHLNLANNRIRYMSLINLPKKVSSLDLRDNLIKDVPSDLMNHRNLEHLQLEGNPLDCSCKNLILRDYLLFNNISIDSVICHSPYKYFGVNWLKIKTLGACKDSSSSFKIESMEFRGLNVSHIVNDNLMVNFKPSKTLSDLDEGQTWVADAYGKDSESDDEVVFLRAKRQQPENLLEGSGNNEVTDYSQTTIPSFSESLMKDNEFLPHNPTKNGELEGSGEGSGFGFGDNSEVEENTAEPVTEHKELYTNPIAPFFGIDSNVVTTTLPNEIIPMRPSVFIGPKDWFESKPSTTTEVPAAVGAEKIHIDKTQTEQSERIAETIAEEKPTIQKTGTYVCIGIMVVLLIGLIAFAVIKGQIRKRRDRRLQRQQKRDIEKASREMVDMNTSLLGKPAPTNGAEKKVNGKYEMVPTHDPLVKKSENGNIASSNNGHAKDKSSPRDNNQNREERPRSLGHADATAPSVAPGAASPDSKKERDSLSSEEIFVPGGEDGPHSNGVTSSDATQPLTNGDRTDSDYLSPSKYVPVYAPDMGRVRIKMRETPKPKTPVLVNRSRSNAGDIVVTPSLAQTPPRPET